jgi:hypothetical protein
MALICVISLIDTQTVRGVLDRQEFRLTAEYSVFRAFSTAYYGMGGSLFVFLFTSTSLVTTPVRTEKQCNYRFIVS